jgi:hypothetical protein
MDSKEFMTNQDMRTLGLKVVEGVIIFGLLNTVFVWLLLNFIGFLVLSRWIGMSWWITIILVNVFIFAVGIGSFTRYI